MCNNTLHITKELFKVQGPGSYNAYFILGRSTSDICLLEL